MIRQTLNTAAILFLTMSFALAEEPASPVKPRPIIPARLLIASLAKDAPLLDNSSSEHEGQQATPAAAQTGIRKRNKLLILAGIAGLGAGIPLMIWGPTSTSQSAYTKTYNTKVVGAVFAGTGGFFLVMGLRRR